MSNNAKADVVRAFLPKLVLASSGKRPHTGPWYGTFRQVIFLAMLDMPEWFSLRDLLAEVYRDVRPPVSAYHSLKPQVKLIRSMLPSQLSIEKDGRRRVHKYRLVWNIS